MKKFLLLMVTLLAPIAGVHSQSVVAPGAKLQKLAGDFAFTEGPTIDKAGNLFFVDQPNNSILEWSADGKLSTFMKPSSYANGMIFDAKGNLIACADGLNELRSIAPDKTVTLLVTNFDGKYLNGPNDVWIAPDGAMYFTDPYYQRTWWGHTNMAQPSQQIYRLSPDRKKVVRLTDDFQQPNGITGTPDGRKLFVADMVAKQTWRFDIRPDGSLTNKMLFCKAGSDGMTIDTEGNLYLTGTAGVMVFDKTGKQIDHIDVPESWTANVCFGGKDHQTLFITASTSLYSVQLKTKGANATK